MIVVGIIGLKNSGKTRLIQKMIEYFSTKNLIVGTIKHAHHNFDIDKKDTDSFLHRKAGAREVIICSSKRWAKIYERDDSEEISLDDLIIKIKKADIVLVEGFKKEKHKKIEIIRNNENLKNPLFKSVSNVIGIVSNHKIKTSLPTFNDQDFNRIGNLILSLEEY